MGVLRHSVTIERPARGGSAILIGRGEMKQSSVGLSSGVPEGPRGHMSEHHVVSFSGSSVHRICRDR